MYEALNNGTAVQKVLNSGFFKKLMQEQGNIPLRPEAFFIDYKEMVQKQEEELNSPLHKLQAQRRAIIENFGERPITQDCLIDIARLNILDKWIGLCGREENNVSFKDVQCVISDIYSKPGSRPRKESLKKFMGDSYKEAIDKVAENMSKASAEIDKKMKDIPEHQKKAWVMDMKTFSLERMADMVNTVANKIEAQKEIQKMADNQKKEPFPG